MNTGQTLERYKGRYHTLTRPDNPIYRGGALDSFANYSCGTVDDCAAGSEVSPVTRRRAFTSAARALRVAKTPRSSSSAGRQQNVTTPCSSTEYKRDTSCTSLLTTPKSTSRTRRITSYIAMHERGCSYGLAVGVLLGEASPYLITNGKSPRDPRHHARRRSAPITRLMPGCMGLESW